jgi:ABC-type lipoprotein release transport system permease subunit
VTVVRLGWRNLWRNPRRSLITISAIATAYCLLIALIGLMQGVAGQMLNNGTGLMLSHLQVHHPDYLPDRSLHDTFDFASINVDADQLHVSPRLHAFGLVSTGDNSAGAQLLGVDVDRETTVSQLLEDLSESELAALRDGGVILGDGLARELKAVPGTEIAVVTQAADGSLGNDLYRVSAVTRTGMKQLDRRLVILPRDRMAELIAVAPDDLHELAIRIDDPMTASEVAASLAAQPAFSDVVVTTWAELSPQLHEYVAMSKGMYLFLIGLVGLFVGIGVLNTMMMALYERTREIGMLMALGMRPMPILGSVLIECVALLVLGLTVGLAFGWLAMRYLTQHGLDLSRWTGELSMMNTRFDPILIAAWNWPQVFHAAIGFAVAAILATCVPAIRAVRMHPVDAMKRGAAE